MKFGKRLQRLLDDSIPQWRNQFIDYKSLKKALKHISFLPHDDETFRNLHTNNPHDQRSHMLQGVDFIGLLNTEIDKMNSFFLEKEEEFVIRLQNVKGKFERIQESRGASLEPNAEVMEIQKAIVNIHGEMVLLENYSALNYTGLVKIIKKYDKLTGGVLRMPFIRSILQEPFFATDIISKLVQDCEETLQSLFPLTRSADTSLTLKGMTTGYDQEFDLFSPGWEVEMNIVGDDDLERMMKNTIAAWKILKEFRKGSSTYNLFSIPPFGYIEEHDESAQHCESATTLVY